MEKVELVHVEILATGEHRRERDQSDQQHDAMHAAHGITPQLLLPSAAISAESTSARARVPGGVSASVAIMSI